MILPTISLRIERWKFNKDYGIYVSTLGNFRDRHKRRLPVKIKSNGYCVIKTEYGLQLAHRIVMLTWKPIPNSENLTVDHLNHNKRDNTIFNLEWVTANENAIRAVRDYVCTKTFSILSSNLPLETYKKHLIGYQIIGLPKIFPTEESLVQEGIKYYAGPADIWKIKVKDAVFKLNNRIVTTQVRITKTIRIKPVFDITEVEVEFEQ